MDVTISTDTTFVDTLCDIIMCIKCIYLECVRQYLEYYFVLVRLQYVLIYLAYIAGMENDGSESPSASRKKG